MSGREEDLGMVVISVKLPRAMLEAVDKVVRERRYASRSELIRQAIRKLLNEEGSV